MTIITLAVEAVPLLHLTSWKAMEAIVVEMILPIMALTIMIRNAVRLNLQVQEMLFLMMMLIQVNMCVVRALG